MTTHSNHSTDSEQAQNGTAKGNGRCSSQEHDQGSHDAGRSEKRRDARDNDSPSPEYLEAYQLFEAWCEERGIAPRDRSIFGESLTRKQTAKLTDYAVPSIRIYYYDLGGRRIDFDRLRFLEVSTKDKPIKGAPTFRYWQQLGTAPRAYFPKVDGINWNDIADSGVKLSIAEGESKGFALTRAGRPCIGIAGVWMSESLRNGQFLLPELARINWRGRKAEIVFDADIREKPGVQAACASLMRELLNCGAKPSSVLLPGPEKGADDFLKTHTVEEYDGLKREDFVLAEPLFELSNMIGSIHKPLGIVTRTGPGIGELHTIHEEREWYSNRRVLYPDRSGKIKISPLFDVWLHWPLRRCFERMAYIPGEPRELGDVWNTWPGWGAEAVEGDVKPWTQFMTHIFGTGEEGLRARQYFEQWCAYPIQHPGKRGNVAAVLVSHDQGSGKSLVFQILGSVYGDANYSEIGTEELKGAFNEFLVNKQFVLGDELTNRENLRVGTELLKRVVSRKRVEINQKYQRQYADVNRVNWGLTSNYADAVYVNDADRRFFVWEVVGGKLPTELRKKLVEWWESGRAAGVLRWHLEQVDLTGFDPFEPAMKTSAKIKAEEANKSELELALDEILGTKNGEGTAAREWGKSDLFTLLDLKVHGRLTSSTRAIASYIATKKDTATGLLTKVDGTPRRLVAIRNGAKWKESKHDERVAEYKRREADRRF